MLHNLGQILVTYYLPDEGEEIDRLVKQEGVKDEQAQVRILGVSCRELGIAIAKQWNFPGTITSSMERLDPEKSGSPNTPAQKRQLIAAFSSEAARVIGKTDPEDDKPVKDLLEHYSSAWKVKPKKFKNMVGEARREFGELASGMSARKSEQSPYMSNYIKAGTDADETEQIQEQESAQDATATMVLEDREVVSESPEATGYASQQSDANPEAVLTEGLQEVTAILVDPQHNLNQVFNVVLETIYRALPLQQILVCLLDAKSKQFVGRFGFGQDVDSFIKTFRFPMKYESNVFHAALKNGVDLYIADTGEEKIKADLPGWYRKVSNAGSFLLFPLVVNKRPLGLIYADHSSPNGVELKGNQLNLIKALRNQIVLDIQSRH
jgi:hypothetical protein